MRAGQWLLPWAIFTGCMGAIAGCSNAPTRSEQAASPKPAVSSHAKTEYSKSAQLEENLAELTPLNTSSKAKVQEYADAEEVVGKTVEYAVESAQVMAARTQANIPQARPLQKRVASAARPKPVARRLSAEQQRLAHLRKRRHREWEAKQEEARQRAEYQHRLQAQEAQLAQSQAAARQQQAQAAAKQQQLRQQYQQQYAAQQAQVQRQQQMAQQAQQQQYAARQAQVQRQQQMARQTRQRQRQAAQRQIAHASKRSHVGYGGRGTGDYYATALSGDFAGYPQLASFIEHMVKRYGFDRGYLYGVFSQVRNRDNVARLWSGNKGGSATPGGWYNYRAKFVTPENVQRGVRFWNEHGVHLQRAARRYGVDPEYIVGIMGVETRWGRIFGKHRVIDALLTSAIVNTRRSQFFFNELENYLLMTRSEQMNPLEPMGSYAGAMGYGQFMPSSFQSFAVDFDGDGIRDLWNPVDAIGSIANYFAKHGWQRGQEVAVPAVVSSSQYATMPDGFKVKYSSSTLASKGIQPRSGSWSKTGRTHLLALTTVPGGNKEPWIGYNNFYVITRYNHSNYYAMAVHQLAQSVKLSTGAAVYASR